MLMDKYARAPTKLELCGPPKAWDAAKKGQIPRELLEQYKKRFGIAYSYLKIIADSNNLKPFDVNVVKAYWEGNNLLENITYEQVKQEFVKHYNWHKSLMELVNNLPEGFKPYHNSHVLYILTVGGKLEVTDENMKRCMILPARVIDKNKVELGDGSLRAINFSLENEIKSGDLVSVHYDSIVRKLSKNELENLKQYSIEQAKIIDKTWAIPLFENF